LTPSRWPPESLRLSRESRCIFATASFNAGAGRLKGGGADDDVPESLAYLPARLPTDRYFDAASRLEDPTSPYYWTGQLSSPAARVFLTPTILHVGRRHALRRTTINARSRIY